MQKLETKNLDQNFARDVAAHPGGENIRLCFACGTCTACCPVAEVDGEFNPRGIIRQVLLGMRKEVLASPLIWRCVQCYSCTSKCPQNVKFREIIRALRELAVEENYADPSLIVAAREADKRMVRLRNRMMDDLLADRNDAEDLRERPE